ncbi:hypothetical protein ACIA48_12790 [Mycobacterium sp. NPDC051804]|uniref:hypothetical protein n=1 Tax=Mycobacterium sp. NPDC051804 TaxID=3364295 RepID=UPI0037A1363B
MRKLFDSIAVVFAAAVSVGALVHAPAAGADPYAPVQTQESAEFAIADGYLAMQTVCTPDRTPVFESVTWDDPGFTPEGGAGMIHDADPALGGHFKATWAVENWSVEYQFC